MDHGPLSVQYGAGATHPQIFFPTTLEAIRVRDDQKRRRNVEKILRRVPCVLIERALTRCGHDVGGKARVRVAWGLGSQPCQVSTVHFGYYSFSAWTHHGRGAGRMHGFRATHRSRRPRLRSSRCSQPPCPAQGNPGAHPSSWPPRGHDFAGGSSSVVPCGRLFLMRVPVDKPGGR